MGGGPGERAAGGDGVVTSAFDEAIVLDPTPLPALPPQPDGVPWPTTTWPTGPLADDVDDAALAAELDRGLPSDGGSGDADALGTTRALLVVHRGRLVVERYGGALDDGTPVGRDTTLPSWSMAKSILHALVGALVGDGALDPRARVVDVAPGAVPRWIDDPDDPRRAITVEHLLRMRPGLAWTEVYTATGDDGGPRSDVVEMLYGTGRGDTAGFVAGKPLDHPPGTTAAFCYSSGTSNLLSAVVREALGGGDAELAALRDEVLGPLGVTSAVPKVDGAGTWIASTYCFLTARDLARFGLLALRDGTWDGRRLLPEGWVDHGRRAQAGVDDDGWAHGAHWWSLPGRTDWWFANGFRGQHLALSPTRDVIVARLGVSAPEHKDALVAHVDALLACFPAGATGGATGG